jgi:hypothetical protein
MAPGRDQKTLFTPDALDFLAVELVIFPAEHGVGPSIAPPGVVTSEGPQAGSQVTVGIEGIHFLPDLDPGGMDRSTSAP